MPTTAQTTYSNIVCDPVINADDAMASMVDVGIAPSLTLAQGTVLGEISATPGTYKAYASGNADGSQNPTGILRRAVTTDSSGNILNANEWGGVDHVTSMFTMGCFRTQDLTGLDTAAIGKLGGHLIEGSVTTGLVVF